MPGEDMALPDPLRARSGIWDRTRQWVNPRPDLLIGDFLGMAAADTQRLLDSYNCSEL